jgi:hypothetical protein
MYLLYALCQSMHVFEVLVAEPHVISIMSSEMGHFAFKCGKINYAYLPEIQTLELSGMLF